MDPKASAMLDKVRVDRRRSNFKKALSRLDDAIGKFPRELSFFTEGIDVAMEAGESLKALQYIKDAQHRLPDERFQIWSFATEKTGTYNDPIVAKFLMEHAVRSGDLISARSVADNIKEHTAEELLSRIRTKKKTLSTAAGGGLAVGDDLENNTLNEALLCLRLNRISEAMDGILGIIDGGRRTNGRFEPFLTDIERQYRDRGEVSFVLGCHYLASGQPDRALEKITHAVELVPSLTEAAIERIESLKEDSSLPGDERQLFLARLFIRKGERQRAADILEQLLERNPKRAIDILETVEPHVTTVGDHLDLHYLYIDTAISLGRAEAATGLLRKIYQVKQHRSGLLTWLDHRARSSSIPDQILVFSAETALNEGMYGKAIEISKEVLSRAPQEELTIKQLLSRHRSHALVGHFYNERFRESALQPRAPQPEFETFDRAEFPDPQKPGQSGGNPAPLHPKRENEAETESAHDGFHLGAGEPQADFGIDNNDFSLGAGGTGGAHRQEPAEPTAARPSSVPSGDHAAPITGDAEADASNATSDGASDLFSYLQRDIPDEPPAHLNDGTGDVPRDDEPAFVSASIPDQEFFDPYEGDEPEPDGFLTLAEDALKKGRLDEALNLLRSEPANFAEDIRRKYLLAECYLAAERPVQALIALKTVHLDTLSRGERRDFLLRIATCYQRLHNHEAAHGVFLRILADHPDDGDIEKMARLNYEDYLRDLSGEKSTLEKTTSL